jgi:probable rRNA maturation factor
MMYRFHVDVNVEVPVEENWVSSIKKAIVATLEHEHVQTDTEVAVLLAGDRRLRDLNQEYMGSDRATDVLSFPAGDPMPGSDTYLGDIAISIPRARIQAAEAGHPVSDELQLLAIHATLHLLGYDHATPEEEDRMWSIQETIQSSLPGDMAENTVE